MNNLYAKAYVEVLEIISHFPKEDYKKIPSEKIQFYEKNKDKSYKFKINPEIDLEIQNISKEAKAIIINLFTDYFATKEQKDKIQEILELNKKINEQEKREKYNPDYIFKKVNKFEQDDIKTPKNTTNTALIEYKESFFTRFKNFIFKILHINK